MSKYRNRKTTVDGIEFHSKKEADFYCELKLRQKANDFLVFNLQPEFVLQNPFTDREGKKHQAIKYRADFMILHHEGTEEVIDVKGMKTKEYLLKKKLFLAKFPQFKFTEV
jgi:hypothetical protein